MHGDPEWALTDDQWVLLFSLRNDIEAAFQRDDMVYLRELASSDAWLQAFGDMGFDEAYDRYQDIVDPQ